MFADDYCRDLGMAINEGQVGSAGTISELFEIVKLKVEKNTLKIIKRRRLISFIIKCINPFWS